MEDRDLAIIRKFSKHCAKIAREHFGRDNIQLNEFMELMCEKGIVKPAMLRNYMIQVEYPRVLRENDGHCGYAKMDMSIEYNVSERQVHRIISGEYDIKTMDSA